jgi:hypothetical protein
MSHWISKLYGQALVANVDRYEIVSKQTWCNLQTININWGIRDFSFTLHFHISEPTTNTDLLKPTWFCNLIYMFTKLIIVLRCNSLHLLPGYEGDSTFIVPMVPTIFEAAPWKIVGTERTIKVLLPEYQVYKCFIILNNCAIQISKLCPFLVDFLSTLVMLFKTDAFSCVHLKKKLFF